MTRLQFDNCILYVEQESGLTTPPEQKEQLWERLKATDPSIAKMVIQLGLIVWDFEQAKKEFIKKHRDKTEAANID